MRRRFQTSRLHQSSTLCSLCEVPCRAVPNWFKATHVTLTKPAIRGTPSPGTLKTQRRTLLAQPLNKYTDAARNDDCSNGSVVDARYMVRVNQDGQLLTLQRIPDTAVEGRKSEKFIASSATATFHASWLWSNDPNYIHATSGQRLRSPITFFAAKATLLSAEVIVWSKDQHHQEWSAMLTTSPPKAPPKGSFHPIGGVYGTHPLSTAETLSDLGNDRTLLKVEWMLPNEKERTRHSLYDVHWLLQCQYNKNALDLHQNESAVTKTIALRAEETLESLSFHDLVEHSSEAIRRYSKFHLLQAIWQKGAALLSNAMQNTQISDTSDTDTAAVALAGKTLSGGRLSHGHLYGDVFYVKAIQSPNNIAYTNVALCPHQDLPYVSDPPGLQLLHCVKNSDIVRGGESVLIDAVAAAEEFRSLAPGLFEILVRCNATFIKQRDGADLVYRRPHIELDATGSHVISVRWAPPFEGPLAIEPRLVDDYYVAYTAFERMLDNAFPRLSTSSATPHPPQQHHHRLLPKISPSLEAALCDYAHTFTWEQRLVPGEILVFNNQRMLHGRRAFSIASSKNNDVKHPVHRLLMGCYLNMDDTLSEYRLLRREQYQGQSLPLIPCTGNGNSFVL